ncbi:hypothetical protein ABT404_10000 [Streptomyces hyaluromycini]|uniref:Secreted protein n=1 Tax=Streptomyces hyaluromycini TaxID=1377993 RepID=A0ABV1WSG9_9ACTN
MSTATGLLVIAGFVCAGYMLGAAHAIRRRDRDLEVMRRQVDAQLLFAEQQFKKQLAAERDRRTEERVEFAYEALGRWLHDLDRTIDEVWSGAHSTEESIRAKAELIVRHWPWETLVVPVEASGARLYWGSEVRALIRKFAGESSHFVSRARTALDQGLGDGARVDDTRGRLWESFNHMHGILDEIRDQARSDLGVR